jgi:hypothetical protein
MVTSAPAQTRVTNRLIFILTRRAGCVRLFQILPIWLTAAKSCVERQVSKNNIQLPRCTGIAAEPALKWVS